MRLVIRLLLVPAFANAPALLVAAAQNPASHDCEPHERNDNMGFRVALHFASKSP
jgi:hypothetical protein